MKYYRTPFTINFEITHNCNALCKFCSIRTSNSAFTSKLRIQNLIDRFKDNDVLRINFFGGEPFLHPNIIDSLIYSKEKGFYVSAVSNGLAIKKAHFNSLKDNIDAIGISIHGLENNHDKLLGIKSSFHRAIAVLERLSNLNVFTAINMTLTSANYDDVEPLVDYVMDRTNTRGIALNRYISSDPNDPLLPTTEQLISALKVLHILEGRYKDFRGKYSIHFPYCLVSDPELKKHLGRCGFGEDYCAVDYNGNVKACSYTNTILGNILDTPLEHIWLNHPLMTTYRACNWLPDRCKKCEDLDKCMAGCKATSSNPYGADSIIGNATMEGEYEHQHAS